MRRLILSLLLLQFYSLASLSLAQPSLPLAEQIHQLSQQHQGQTGVWVLEKGEDALIARAWLGQQAARSIDIQYFIWSSDNIGALAAEGLLSAAEQGVRVRVLVDDLLIDAPDKTLIALAQHPQIDIRIYNPLHSVGVALPGRLVNILTNFKGANQRMHDKSFIVDGAAAIIGGRNMADEYFDYDNDYNFRDRDLLLIGPGVTPISDNFEEFWNSPLSKDVMTLLKREEGLSPKQQAKVYRQLHDYAGKAENYAPEVRQAIQKIPTSYPTLIQQLVWCRPRFLHDRPGKEAKTKKEAAEQTITPALYTAVNNARSEVLIQSPYLVLSDLALELMKRKISQGVRVRINTNSLPATDNLQAFSGYIKQRKKLLKAGIEIREFRPDAKVRQALRDGFAAERKGETTFAIHAKTLVVDRQHLYIGTFNLDPRSMNLNTEIGVHIDDKQLAEKVAESIETDMAPGNSWNPAVERAIGNASWGKRLKIRFWRLIPMDPIL